MAKFSCLTAFLLLIFNLSKSQVPPLSTQGGKIVDAQGKVIQFRGVNWWGANGSLMPYGDSHKDGTDTHGMPFGLHLQRIEVMAEAIKDFGFNAVRLPFSNEMLHSQEPMEPAWVGPNYELAGKTPLQVLDRVIEILTEKELMVLLNNHSTTTHWCCGYDFNGLWYGRNGFWSQTTEDWIGDWEMLTRRYQNNPMVVGADLRNEVRPRRGRVLPLPVNPNWGRKNQRDWHRAATRAGDAIHRINPDWLIVVEGINARTLWLTRLQFPHLKPVKKHPIELKIPRKLVYEVHNYAFNWDRGNLLRRKKMVTYGQLDSLARRARYEENWGFVTRDSFPHQAPVILGELGCSGTSDDAGPYLRDLSGYLHENGLGFFWWTLEEDVDNPGSFGIMNPALDRINVDQDWRWDHLQKLFQE
ncbi:MAG: cellulase family glycosylhydrolase [Bacteroidia bacterium]|nr:cellulase family glycosylhydrolase [Bacteroidia bacterium]